MNTGRRESERPHLLLIEPRYGEHTAKMYRNLSDAAWHYDEFACAPSTFRVMVYRLDDAGGVPVLVNADKALADFRNATRASLPIDPSASLTLSDYQWQCERGD